MDTIQELQRAAMESATRAIVEMIDKHLATVKFKGKKDKVYEKGYKDGLKELREILESYLKGKSNGNGKRN